MCKSDKKRYNYKSKKKSLKKSLFFFIFINWPRPEIERIDNKENVMKNNI